MATERIIEHVERLRQHPEPVRYRIAMGTAFAATALVAAGWAVALTTSGTLALKDPEPVAGPTPESELARSFSETGSAFSNLMGAAGAAFNATSSEAALRIIDTRTSSTIEEEEANAAASATVIPF
ncbi:MAG TPA: hypothetical protein VNU25_01185 [Candidatus Paceibacterota bacterium]|nr:hypothetical protein [Candidatus Paceibacterota bacterium]